MSEATLSAQLSANDAFINQAHQLLAQNQLQAAAKVLNEAQRNTTDDPRIFMLGAKLAEQSGKTAEALEAMEHAVKLAPQWWPVQLEFGLLLARLDKHASALAQAERIFALEQTERRALAGVIDIATRCGAMQRGAEYTLRALQVYPDDQTLLLALARLHYHGGKRAAALPVWDQLIALDPDNLVAHYGKLVSLVELQRASEAKASSERLLSAAPDNPVYRYYAQIVAGDMPATQPAELQTERFNSLARNYDLHMVRVLRYDLPKQTAQQLLEIFPDRRFNLLDLGCGTGLLGVYLGKIDGAMVGVDVSGSMIEQAAQHGLYAKFHKVNVLDAVRDTPANLYEVVAALDVFPYIGDLTPVLANVHRILQSDGFFFFSTELAHGQDYLLQANGRYAHSRAYLERLLGEAGYAVASIDEKTIRLEAGQPVRGLVVTAQKGR